ncbi:MAG: agmatine deiminase family protein [Oligoflexales bacterium]|nr:agmatine deiminase family protein [Oligoflexales bacterium]
MEKGRIRSHTGQDASDFQNLFSFPAEFDRHEAIWISVKDEKYWSGGSRINVVMEIIRELEPYVKVKATVPSQEALRNFKKLLSGRNINDSHVTYMVMNNGDEADPWLRDHGPIFLRGPSFKLKIADFRYDFYGESSIEPSPGFIKNVEEIDRTVAKKMGIPLIGSGLVSEGGNREFNGNGTMMALEVTELSRNPGKTRLEIENELLRILGQKKMIWLKRSVADEDKSTNGPILNDLYSTTITGGHIDEVARFAEAGTVLLAEVSMEERDRDPLMRISYERMEENYRILKSATDQDGKPFRIVRIPVPDTIISEYAPRDAGDYALVYFKGAGMGKPVRYVLATGYLNFLVTNGVVLGAKYWREGRPESTRLKDERVRNILREVFPGRNIIQLDAEAFNHGGGGIHCNTQQEPASMGFSY